MSTPPAAQLSTPALVSPRASPTTVETIGAPAPAAATRPADSPAQLLTVLAGCAMIVLLGVELARRVGWFRRPWPPARCLVPGDVGRVGLTLGAMIVGGFLSVRVLATIAGPPDVPANPAAAPTPSQDAWQSILLAVLYLGGLACVPLAAKAVGRWRDHRPRIGLPPFSPARDAGVVAAGAPMLIALTTGVMILTQLLWLLIGYQHASAHQMLLMMDRSRSHPLIVAVTALNAVVLAPVFEEVLFRGHVQTALVGLLGRRWPGIVLAAGLFASLHEAWTIPPIFVLGLFIGYVYERTSNLWLAIALHASFNGFNTLLMLTNTR